MFSLWGKIKAGLAIAGAVIIAIGIAVLKGRAEGIRHMEAEQAKRRAESISDRKEIDDEISQMGSQDVDQNLARWNRDE